MNNQHPNLPFPLIDTAAEQHYVQSYNSEPMIDGVQIKEVKSFTSEEGDFSEVTRFTENGELADFPGFKLRQINRAQIVAGSIKAWHFHVKQNEIWYVPPSDKIIVGLWDLRKDSPTAGMARKVLLGGSSRGMVFIPKGVAHGSWNISDKAVNLMYFVDQNFSADEPDELRMPWDSKGAEFWEPTRD